MLFILNVIGKQQLCSIEQLLFLKYGTESLIICVLLTI